jgi:hypothetical protein
MHKAREGVDNLHGFRSISTDLWLRLSHLKCANIELICLHREQAILYSSVHWVLMHLLCSTRMRNEPFSHSVGHCRCASGYRQLGAVPTARCELGTATADGVWRVAASGCLQGELLLPRAQPPSKPCFG